MNPLAAIHVAKKQLGLDDDTYRAALKRVTGKTSAKDLTDAERKRVVAAFRKQGFKQASNGSRKRLDGKFAKKLQALWIAGWNLGVVDNRDDAALLAFVKRQTGIDHTRFLRHAEDAAKAVEALKSWLAREAGVDWTFTSTDTAWSKLSGYRIASAQFLKSEADGPRATVDWQFWQNVNAITGKVRADMAKEADWIPVMNAFGKEVRKLKGKG